MTSMHGLADATGADAGGPIDVSSSTAISTKGDGTATLSANSPSY